MPISFDNIPTTIRVPWVYVEFSSERAIQGDTVQPYKTLLIGQRTPSGEAPANYPIRITSDAAADTAFGKGSMLAQMVKSYRKIDEFTEMYCLPVNEDAAGVAAKGKLAFTGSATASGTLYLYIGGVSSRITVGVTAGMDLSVLASNVAEAINASADVCVSAAATDGNVDLTCKWKGLTGNDLDIRLNYYSGEATPSGLTVGITAMAGGTSNPDITTALANMGDSVHYNIIGMAFTDGNNLRLLDEELDDRWGPLRQMEGLAFCSVRGSLSELTTFGNSNNTQNLCIVPATGSPTSPWEVAVKAAAQAAYFGNIDPARPFQTLEMTGMLAPSIEDRFTMQERNLLLYDGVSTWKTTEDGIVQTERLITSYKKSPAGADDRSYLDITTPLTLGRLRYSLRNYLLLRYPRHKLASGDITQFGAGQAIATPDSIKGDIIGWFKRQMEQGLVEDMNSFKEGLIVERNANDENRVDILLTPDLVNQLMIMAGKMAFLL